MDESFWKRPASEVAEDLVGKTIVEYKSLNNIMDHGILTEVDAYESAHKDRQEELFTQEPGKIGSFRSRRGGISVITAHEEGGTGLITLRRLDMKYLQKVRLKSVCLIYGD